MAKLRIATFNAENLFSRPVSHWQSRSPLPVPDAADGAAPTAG